MLIQALALRLCDRKLQLLLLLLAFPFAQNVPIDAKPSLQVIGFAFALSMLTGILFGVAPAWISAQAEPFYIRP